MKLFVFSARSYDRPALIEAAGDHELLFTEQRLTTDTANLASGCDAVALFTADDASAAVLEILHSLGIRFVLLRSVGFDHVDLEKARMLGMRVANVPEYSPNSVAEHAVALLMAVNRKIIQGQMLQYLGDYTIESLMGFDLCRRTAGVIGTGRIGLAFAKIMRGFGARVIAFDPQINQEAVDLGIKYTSFEELMRTSDVISLHCPLLPSTRHLISETQFLWMRPGAILINTSRGAVINTDDLINALDSGRLGAACLDVYEGETGLFFENHRSDIIHDKNFLRLKSFKNVLITCHQGFLTSDAIRQIAATTIGNLNCWQNQLPCRNELSLFSGIALAAAERSQASTLVSL